MALTQGRARRLLPFIAGGGRGQLLLLLLLLRGGDLVANSTGSVQGEQGEHGNHDDGAHFAVSYGAADWLIRHGPSVLGAH